MKKLSILTALIIFSSVILNAQEATEKQKPSGYISLNVGLSSPLGDYASYDIGGASSGAGLTFNMSAPIKKSHLGIATNISIASYGMDDSPFIAQQVAVMNSCDIPSNTYRFKSKTSYANYSQFRAMTGLYATIPLGKRFNFDSRILFGINAVSRPYLAIDLDFYGINYYEKYYQDETSAVALAYNFGFGVRYNLGKKQRLCLMLSFDYTGGNASFEINSYSLYKDKDGYLNDGKNTINQSYSVATYNSMIGFGYVFGKK